VKSFVLAIDVGNTNTRFGLFNALPPSSQLRLLARWNLPTKIIARVSSLEMWLKREVQKRFVKDSDLVVGISSVVPENNRVLDQAISYVFQVSPLFISGLSPLKIKININKRGKLGADRIVNARAAWERNQGPAIIIDMGTATTFDCLTRQGEFIGGAILPGPGLWIQSLYEKTSQLPLYSYRRMTTPIARDTTSALQAGLYYGYRGLVKELIVEMKKTLGPNTKVLGTGGYSNLILKNMKEVNSVIPDLTLMGIYWALHDRSWRKKK
jgi:type III pantothenate kinase